MFSPSGLIALVGRFAVLLAILLGTNGCTIIVYLNSDAQAGLHPGIYSQASFFPDAYHVYDVYDVYSVLTVAPGLDKTQAQFEADLAACEKYAGNNATYAECTRQRGNLLQEPTSVDQPTPANSPPAIVGGPPLLISPPTNPPSSTVERRPSPPLSTLPTETARLKPAGNNVATHEWSLATRSIRALFRLWGRHEREGVSSVVSRWVALLAKEQVLRAAQQNFCASTTLQNKLSKETHPSVTREALSALGCG